MVQNIENKKKRVIKDQQKKLQENLDLAAGKSSIRVNKYNELSDAGKRLASSLHKGSGIRPLNIRPSSSRHFQPADKSTPIVHKK